MRKCAVFWYGSYQWQCIWWSSLVRQCEWILGWTHNWISNSQRPLLSLRLDLIQTLPSDFLIGLRSCCSPDWLNISADIEFNSVKTNCDRFPQTGREVFCCFRVLQIKGQFWHRLSQIFSKKCDISRKCVRGFETNKRIIGIAKIVLVFSPDQSRPI